MISRSEKPVSKRKTATKKATKANRKDPSIKHTIAIHNLLGEAMRQKISELEHQINGYKAVISYLEFQLGLKDSQGGNQE